MTTPARCVVDTNVGAIANAANHEAGMACIAASARALHSVISSGHLFVDNDGLIVREYRSNLHASGQPGPGDVFLKWVLTNEWGSSRITRVQITQDPSDPQNFLEVPPAPPGIRYDPSDRKFLAVAAAHPERPPILQSFDSKWWGWRHALAAAAIKVHFLCEKEIAARYAQKMAL